MIQPRQLEQQEEINKIFLYYYSLSVFTQLMQHAFNQQCACGKRFM